MGGVTEMDDKVYTELKMKSFLMAISGVLILWVPVLLLHLSIVLFAALITYSANGRAAHLAWLGVFDCRFCDWGRGGDTNQW